MERVAVVNMLLLNQDILVVEPSLSRALLAFMVLACVNFIIIYLSSIILNVVYRSYTQLVG